MASVKSNDKIPHDEMLLAEAIAAARARNLGWTGGVCFRDSHHNGTGQLDPDVSYCCAKGALFLADRASDTWRLHRITRGNDRDLDCGWTGDIPDDCGESLGWAFRCAMEDV